MDHDATSEELFRQAREAGGMELASHLFRGGLRALLREATAENARLESELADLRALLMWLWKNDHISNVGQEKEEEIFAATGMDDQTWYRDWLADQDESADGGGDVDDPDTNGA